MIKSKILSGALAAVCFALPSSAQNSAAAKEQIQSRLNAEYPSLEIFYQDIHSHPELSFREERTSGKIADELQKLGLEVTPRVGGHGVVGVSRNGPGPTILIRADMDALPVKEQTALPYASTVRATDDKGIEVDVMHACGHDVNVTCLIGTARMLIQLKERWRGTLVFIGQPAEERGAGAKAMLAEGLFTRFPKPDYALALHASAELAHGVIGLTEGYAMANVDSVIPSFTLLLQTLNHRSSKIGLY